MRTEQMLLTAPVSITGMVLGKYLAAMTIYAGCLAVSCVEAQTISSTTEPTTWQNPIPPKAKDAKWAL